MTAIHVPSMPVSLEDQEQGEVPVLFVRAVPTLRATPEGPVARRQGFAMLRRDALDQVLPALSIGEGTPVRSAGMLLALVTLPKPVTGPQLLAQLIDSDFGVRSVDHHSDSAILRRNVPGVPLLAPQIFATVQRLSAEHRPGPVMLRNTVMAAAPAALPIS